MDLLTCARLCCRRGRYVLKVSKQRDMSDASFRRDLEAAHNLTLREAPLFFAKEDMEAKHEQMLAYKSQMR